MMFCMCKLKEVLLVCLAAATLSAGCSSGGDTATSSAVAPTGPSLGVLLDAEVEGVRYVTPSRSGVTNAAGEFEYQAGEEVEFYLGELFLGRAPGQAVVDIFTLVGVSAPPQTLSGLRHALDPGLETSATIGSAPEGESLGSIAGANVGGMNRALNIAILLQTLDDDMQADNGIRIPAEVAAKFTPDLLWLDADYLSFRDNIALAHVLRSSATEGLLEPRPVLKASLALAHAYASLNLNMQTDVIVGFEVGGALTDVTYGHVARRNALGLVEMRTTNEGPNEINDTVWETTYDTNGETTLYQVARNVPVGGTADSYQRSEATARDAFGQTLIKEYRDESGAVTGTDFFRYDDFGQPLLIEITRNGTVRDRQQWFLDESGRRIRMERNGEIFHVDELDQFNRWLSLRIDRDGDGTIEDLARRSFNERGQLVFDLRERTATGELWFEERYTYNDMGQLVQSRIRDLRSGELDTVAMVYDAAGLLQTRSFDHGTDGEADGQYDYVWDAAGRIAERNWDANSDGEYERRQTYTFDVDGRFQRVQVSAGDTINEIAATYDESGRMTLLTLTDETGLVQAHERYTDWVSVHLPLAFDLGRP